MSQPEPQRFRPAQLRTHLAELKATMRRNQQFTVAGVVTAIFLGLIAMVAMIGWEEGLFVGFFFVVIFGLVFGMIALGAVKRRLAKVDFAIGLVDQLFDDLPSWQKIGFMLDTRSYAAAGKQYWSGRSRHGNAKYRYDDRWLRIRFALVDGTEVTLERRADVKVRKGAIQKEKRRLYLKVRPNPKTLGQGQGFDGLQELVRQRVKETFHDPPEKIAVHPSQAVGEIRVRIHQWDAPIREAEAFSMLETVLLFLQMRS